MRSTIALQERRSPSEVSDSWFGQPVTTLGKTEYPKKGYLVSVANISELNELMISNGLGMQLHDRWIRGQMLTDEEQAQLEDWYQQQDAEEAKKLHLASTTGEVSDLQAQVETALTQLATVIQRVQQITSENETLRREISTLRQQLTPLKSA